MFDTHFVREWLPGAGHCRVLNFGVGGWVGHCWILVITKEKGKEMLLLIMLLDQVKLLLFSLVSTPKLIHCIGLLCTQPVCNKSRTERWPSACMQFPRNKWCRDYKSHDAYRRVQYIDLGLPYCLLIECTAAVVLALSCRISCYSVMPRVSLAVTFTGMGNYNTGVVRSGVPRLQPRRRLYCSFSLYQSG